MAEIYSSFNQNTGGALTWNRGTLKGSQLEVDEQRPLTATASGNLIKVWFSGPKGNIRLAFTKNKDSSSWQVKQPFAGL